MALERGKGEGRQQVRGIEAREGANDAHKKWEEEGVED